MSVQQFLEWLTLAMFVFGPIALFIIADRRRKRAHDEFMARQAGRGEEK